MPSPPAISPSSSADHVSTSATTAPSSSSSASSHPSQLAIPTAPATLSASQSPTTPVAIPRSSFLDSSVDPRSGSKLDDYRISPAPASASSTASSFSSRDARLAADEDALNSLSAQDLHTGAAASSSKMGNVSEQSALDQVLSGILTMQKEVSDCSRIYTAAAARIH